MERLGACWHMLQEASGNPCEDLQWGSHHMLGTLEDMSSQCDEAARTERPCENSLDPSTPHTVRSCSVFHRLGDDMLVFRIRQLSQSLCMNPEEAEFTEFIPSALCSLISMSWKPYTHMPFQSRVFQWEFPKTTGPNLVPKA